MIPFGVENVLLYYRGKENLSQIQVCEGICSKMELSRIEGGMREYDFLMWETLLERMGKTSDRFEFILKDEDAYLYDIRETIAKSVEGGSEEEAVEALRKYEKVCPIEEKLHQQFLLYYQARLLQKRQGDEEKIQELLQRAINLTRPDFKEQRTSLMLFSTMEVKIIYRLFLYNAYTEESISSLMRFMDQMYDEEEKEEMMVPFLYRLAEWYEAGERPYDTERVAEKAIRIIRAGRGLGRLNDLCFYRLKAQLQIYRGRDGWEEKKKEFLEECSNIYYMYMIEEQPEKMEEVLRIQEEVKCEAFLEMASSELPPNRG